MSGVSQWFIYNFVRRVQKVGNYDDPSSVHRNSSPVPPCTPEIDSFYTVLQHTQLKHPWSTFLSIDAPTLLILCPFRFHPFLCDGSMPSVARSLIFNGLRSLPDGVFSDLSALDTL